MRRDYFMFAGVNSLAYDVWLTEAHTEDVPAKNVEATAIAGRNGDLLTDKERWDNIEITYSAAILQGFSDRYSALMAAITSPRGYQRLEDSLRPDEFRLAVFRDAVRPKNTPYNKAGQFDLLFFCKPQRFLKSGEESIPFAEAGTLYNHTLFDAQPIITVYGSGAGTVSISGCTVEIKAMEDQITLDCELMDAYRKVGGGASQNMNGSIYAPEFPVLKPGDNTISWTGGVTAVDIIPRWWTL